MAKALVDTSVLFGAAYRRDRANEAALPILQGIDDGSLPEAVVIEYVLAETLNGLVSRASHDDAVDFLNRIEENPRFHVSTLVADSFTTAKGLFRRHEPLSFVDACIAAHMQTEEREYLYAFNDDFDVVEDLSRLDTPTNPFSPE